MGRKFGLIILDGWGLGKKDKSDAVFQAKTPNMDKYINTYPNATLTTFGEAVGLPEGQMGNSEVGHLNIGAGRIVYQELTRINRSIKMGEFAHLPNLKKLIELAKEGQRKVHLIGLVSRGGVHSSQEHLHALIDVLEENGLKDVFVHAMTDGRDCDPKSGKLFIGDLEKHLEGKNTKIATVIGRYYGMDRDKRWERIATAYDAMVRRKGEEASSALEVIDNNYAKDITDEFIPATCINIDKNCAVEKDDIVLCFNFRTDRLREMTEVLSQQDFPEHNMQTLPLHYFTMTSYDDNFKGVNVLFSKDNLVNTLGEVVSKQGKTQIRIAETEKYPHVTFFFSGGREEEFEGETRLMAASPKVATYDLQPEMSAPEVTEKIIGGMREITPDFFCLNFANADMVGHTGVFDAIVKSVETVDECMGKIIEEGQKHGYEFLVIADHGNADFAINPDGSPNTAHSLNPVPVVLITEDQAIDLKHGILADVAPSILQRMDLPVPAEMTGESLVIRL